MSLSILDLPWLEEAPAGFSQLCKEVEQGKLELAPGAALRKLATYRLNGRQSLVFSRVLSRLRASGTDLSPLSVFRLGFLSNGTSDLIADCLAAGCARHGVAVELTVANYDSVMQEALDEGSRINGAKLDAVLVAVDHRWFAGDAAELDGSHGERVAASLARLKSVVEGISAHSGAPAILQTIPVPSVSLFGSLDRRVPGSPRWFIHELNQALPQLALQTGAYLLDVATLSGQIGGDRWFNSAEWLSYKNPFSSRCAPIYADHVGRLLGAIRGKSRKCLVLDLDNTLWGGVIGDDGLQGIKIGQGNATAEAFLQLQKAAAALRERGIFLAVCSKNNDDVARLHFREHPEMFLREEHI